MGSFESTNALDVEYESIISMRSRRSLCLWSCLFGTVLAATCPRVAFADTPGGLSVEALELALGAEQIVTLQGPETPLTVTIRRPQGWTLRTDEASVLLFPEPNPDDLGVLVLVAKDDGGSLESQLRSSTQRLLPDLELLSQEALTLMSPSDQTLDAPLLHLAGQFDNSRPARFMLSGFRNAGYTIVVLAGASESVFGPYQQLLRDTMLALRFAP